MHKRFALTLAGSVAMVSMMGAAAAQDRVNFYNWSDYIGETTTDDFTAATGIDVVYDVYDSNDILEAKLLAGNSGYDVVVPSAFPWFHRQVAAGIYQPLDLSLLPNFANLDPALMEVVPKGPDGEDYAAMYAWGTTGIGYNAALVAERMPDAPVDSLDMIFDPEIVANIADCGVSILGTVAEVLPIVLNYMGLDPNSEDPDDLAAAEALLGEVRPHIRYFHDSQYINDLATGEICIGMGFSGDIYLAADRAAEAENGIDIRYVVPAEGTNLWFDLMAIPADAPNVEAAHTLINFLLEPEVMASMSNYVWYANPVPASLPLVDEEIATDPQIFLSEELIARLFVTEPRSPAYERLRTRAWTRIRTGR